MATNPIKLSTVALALVVITATELTVGMVINRLPMSPLLCLGLFRLIQAGAIIWIVIKTQSGLASIGWSAGQWAGGFFRGAVWSAGFGLIAGCAMLVIYWTGRNPLQLVRSPLPSASADLLVFFLVGGIIAPVAEELFFRGILYSYFRRWGILTALAASTALFVALHSVHGLPFTQIVGGVVFAISYEVSGNLMVPITIHALGNLAIFSLSLL
jgi:membrane protease YdiL (CAAX protease family)